MNTNTKGLSHSVAEQTTNNTTGWIGHIPGDTKTIAMGQTFTVNAEGDLKAIEVYSNMVKEPSKVIMSIHNFNPGPDTWGPALASTSLELKNADTGKWIAFNIPGLHLLKGKSYGFRIETPDSFIGIGEAIGSAKEPLSGDGKEFRFKGNEQQGDAYSYFSLAFKVDVKAA